MNKKFYVPFETAKMLKKAGYPQAGSDMYYNPNGELKTQVELIAGYKEDYPIMITYYYATPAYCEMLDWLDGKGIYVSAFLSIGETDNKDTYKIWWKSFIDVPNHEEQSSGVYSTREEALNNGIIKALKML